MFKIEGFMAKILQKLQEGRFFTFRGGWGVGNNTIYMDVGELALVLSGGGYHHIQATVPCLEEFSPNHMCTGYTM